ncbi:MAG: conditioned medium-induced protein 4 [Halobacteriota archaeon]
MDEKTAELREIFLDATGADTVTESQAESPGSLTHESADVDDRIEELIGTMRERYEFDTDLDAAVLDSIVRGFFEDRSDEELAAALDLPADVVFDARMDVHLVSEADRDAPFPIDRLRRLVVEGRSIDERKARLDVDGETVERYSRVVAADLESTRANDRFRDEFRALLTDFEIEGPLARDAREDGLREATEDIETDVSF